eukprot:2782353-Pyramimonas_sp.AAC.1
MDFSTTPAKTRGRRARDQVHGEVRAGGAERGHEAQLFIHASRKRGASTRGQGPPCFAGSAFSRSVTLARGSNARAPRSGPL